MYDDETGLYYLRSRYYRPEWGRFLNTDAVFDGANLYRYCNNNAINNSDADGNYTEFVEAYFVDFTYPYDLVGNKLIFNPYRIQPGTYCEILSSWNNEYDGREQLVQVKYYVSYNE